MKKIDRAPWSRSRNRLAACRWALLITAAATTAVVVQSGTADRDSGARHSDSHPVELSVNVRSLPTLRVQMDPVPLGLDILPEAAAGSLAGSCAPITVTHTDASFTGGQYNLQGGFVEGEIAIAVYTLPPDAFPIRVDTAEIIFGTQNASVPTTTEWSFLVWEGLPAPGNLVAEFSSDGLILPHLQMPPGTSGTNLLVEVDPGDPDQIFILANPDNAFSIGYRIDQHNNQSGTGCLTEQPASSNAFTATDLSGVSSPNGNWIFAIDCGAFGCPADFSSFANFNIGGIISCSPSGDWVMRASYTSLSCVPASTGGCCLPSGFCKTMTEAQCADGLGLYLGDEVSCQGVNCAALFGACCFGDKCLFPAPQASCLADGGVWLGSGVTCSGNPCTDPTGACCIESTGACDQFTEEICGIVDGVWQGPGVQCADITCFPAGACCLPDGGCEENVSPESCADLGGAFQGDGTSCASTSCPQPEGACCLANGNCVVFTETSCNNVGGTWAGPATDCSDAGGSGTADICEDPTSPCPADLNRGGVVNVFDLLILLDSWGTCPACPADLDGNGVVNVFDLLILLDSWGPCP